jgi:hypothetical protein
VAERRDRAPACEARREVAIRQSQISATLGERIMSVIAMIMLVCTENLIRIV